MCAPALVDCLSIPLGIQVSACILTCSAVHKVSQFAQVPSFAGLIRRIRENSMQLGSGGTSDGRIQHCKPTMAASSPAPMVKELIIALECNTRQEVVYLHGLEVNFYHYFSLWTDTPASNLSECSAGVHCTGRQRLLQAFKLHQLQSPDIPFVIYWER